MIDERNVADLRARLAEIDAEFAAEQHNAMQIVLDVATASKSQIVDGVSSQAWYDAQPEVEV
jgi:hypothetical protein